MLDIFNVTLNLVISLSITVAINITIATNFEFLKGVCNVLYFLQMTEQ